MEAAEILLVILSATLALFLILAIVLVVYLIKIVQQIKRITTTAERAAYKFESLASIVQKAAAPAMITKLVSELVQKFTDTKSGKRKD